MSTFVGTANFTPAEVACRCGCGLMPSQEFMERVQRARNRTNFAWTVSSGARCPAYNAIISDTGDDGPHTKDAIDIAVSGVQAWEVLAAFVAENFSGIGVNQRGPHNKRFIHGDDLPNEDGQPRPHVWTY